jgi:hypothetical protein
MSLSDSRRNPYAVIDSRAQLSFAPKHDPPNGLVAAAAVATSVFLSRPNRVHLHCGSRVCPYQGFAKTDYSIPRLLGYMSEQAIYMVNSFQFPRSARLILAHRP